MGKKVVLIDGNSIAYRAFFALPLLNNDKGVYTNAVYGFTTMLLKIIEEEKPSHLLVAFDAGKTTFRHKTFTEYKGGRQKTPPELSEQFPLIRELLDAFNIKRFELADYEADDIIGTISKDAANDGLEVKVFSGDKDLLQLVSDKITVAINRKGISEVDTYDEELIAEKYGIPPLAIIDMKGLMGDTSDNIPGVPGVGEKTALKLLKQFGSLEETLQSIDQVSGAKLKEKLADNKEQALMSKKLATIYRDVPLPLSVDDLAYSGFEVEKVANIFNELGFNSLISRIGGEEVEQSEVKVEDISYEILSTFKAETFTSETALHVEMIDDHYHQSPILGISLANETGNFFLPVDIAKQSEEFKNWAESENNKKIVFDGKMAIVSLKWQGITLNGVDFDVHLASYLVNPNDSSDKVAEVAKIHGVTFVKDDEAVYGKGAKQKVPETDHLADHVARKAFAIRLLKEKLEEKMKESDLVKLYEELEFPLSKILAEMEYTGIKVDVSRLQEMGKDLSERIKNLENEIHEIAGTEFNINSPKQLGEVLFEKLELPPVKKTKTGYSTSADVLEKLSNKHPIIEKILLFRQLGKLNSTYIEGLLKVVNENTGKVNTRFNQALTQTGRLSSIDPNLQNIPIRLEEGRKIRQAFTAEKEGWLIFAADYSQVELRVLAHIADDAKLVEAFREGLDIHTKTAMDVFNVSEEEVTSEMRRSAKAVNFGIVYGISDYGLSQSLNITRKEAASFIEKYFESFPGVKQYMADIVQQAKQEGYVTTLFNRRRYLPEITSRNFNLRSFAERTAMNTPIQGSAADIIKVAMVKMAKRLKDEKLQTKMLLQVHDELIFEAPEDEIEKLKEIVPDVMENAMQLKVPLKVDYSFGPSWYDAK
ncbi:DNA polymerase I [Lottiidibacillus patelloidae]|uniref:DNA polymerase I n=1 Tax=Lottiidibacillus patelloidae TaxID=2670334 RepID=A0A263BW53_9BACI|nr:DNA polymerase I [Lottiidibacillus patelloidae]OZM57945.1 DNA polymerase I [Lottiidibacillus patelloidae]